jgi:hypothetical protein
MTYPSIVLAISMGLAAAPPAGTNMAANSVSNGSAPQTSTPAAAKAQTPATEKVYCTSGTISGSRIVKQECKTKSQWAKEGISIDDLMNSEQE